MTALLDSALAYSARGWSMLPTIGKRPAIRSWKSAQREPADDATLREWFARATPTGLAVVLGNVSGGLAARDFDDAAAYARWAEAHPTLARELPTAQTRRGYHVYATIPGARTIDVGDGELRGEGAYVMLPPSAHPLGGNYGPWLVPLRDCAPPCIDPREAGFLGSVTETTEGTETAERTEDGIGTGGIELDSTIERAILETMPTGYGKRNRRLFDFARRLKAIPALADSPASALRPYVKRWHAAALAMIGTKPFIETWGDFARAWPQVRLPAGTEPLGDALQRAAASAPPECSADYGEPKAMLLAALCRELQRGAGAGAGAFFLSARTAGRLLGIDAMTSWRWLAAMKADGVLELVDAGTRGPGGRAARFRYKGD